MSTKKSLSQTVTLIPCIGCNAMVPDLRGPAHPYIGASAGCWTLFGEVCSNEYQNERLLSIHKLTVDTYAVQHPGTPSPQSIRSVAGHLISLHLVMKKGITPGQTLIPMRRALRRPNRFHWLEPPCFKGMLTILDIKGATDAADHIALVKRWARAVWEAWDDHHATIAAWAAES